MDNEKESIEVDSCTVSDLFSRQIPNKNIFGSLAIPEYQRPYVWGEKEVSKLIADLKEYFTDYENREKPFYYLGTIILHKNNGHLNIIDGQQRITTLAIIQHIIGDKLVPMIKFASPITIKNIKANHRLIKDLIKDFKPPLEKLNITLVATESEDDAYTFFETQNTGGVRLSGIDIIKAHHLREINPKGEQQNKYAKSWESLKSIDIVVEQLIKARRWNKIKWIDVPSDKDLKGTKQSIVDDFSERTLPANKKMGFQYALSSNNYSLYHFISAPLAIRQPLADGENFIDFIITYANLYKRLFLNKTDVEISEKYYEFNRKIIQVVDGTAFLKELYEISMLCYVSKFGVGNLYEAALWIFRYCYSRRLSNRKTVRENTIPAFVSEHPILDILLACFTHEEVIESLKKANNTINTENTEKNTVKRRFIKRVSSFFKFEDEVESFDKNFVESIIKNTNEE